MQRPYSSHLRKYVNPLAIKLSSCILPKYKLPIAVGFFFLVTEPDLATRAGAN